MCRLSSAMSVAWVTTSTAKAASLSPPMTPEALLTRCAKPFRATASRFRRFSSNGEEVAA